jgi:hypothetical protein
MTADQDPPPPSQPTGEPGKDDRELTPEELRKIEEFFEADRQELEKQLEGRGASERVRKAVLRRLEEQRRGGRQ